MHDDTVTAIELFCRPADAPSPPVPDVLHGPRHVVTADRSGFVQASDVQTLVETARSHDVFVCVDVRAGDQVLEGTPVGTVWGGSDIAAEVRRAITVGYERTNDQDVAFGFRQLEDIAVKAMSPAINDPVTAAHAIGHMGALLVRLLQCRLGLTVHDDDQRSEIRRAAQLVFTQATDIRKSDMDFLGQVAHQVDLALSGAPGAYEDRAGETRSL